MEGLDILFILENIVFFILVGLVAWMQTDTPQWVYTSLLIFSIYWLIRFIFTKQGMTRVLYIYGLNMFILLILFYYYNKKWM